MSVCARPLTFAVSLMLSALVMMGPASADVLPAPSPNPLPEASPEPLLDPLFEQLRHAPDTEHAWRAERKIWQRWMHHPNEQVNERFARGVQLMNAGALVAAVEQLSTVLKLAPEFAEAWNKRATAYYLLNEMSASVADIERTLLLEPRHFGAWSGLGLIFLSRGDLQGALSAFEKVLQIHPRSESARLQVENLRRSLHRKSI